MSVSPEHAEVLGRRIPLPAMVRLPDTAALFDYRVEQLRRWAGGEVPVPAGMVAEPAAQGQASQRLVAAIVIACGPAIMAFSLPVGHRRPRRQPDGNASNRRVGLDKYK